jgi:hypothetical protein
MEAGSMVVIGAALLWFGYTVGIWGYCLVRGYDVPFSGIFGGTWPGGGQAAAPATTLPADPGTGVYNV